MTGSRPPRQLAPLLALLGLLALGAPGARADPAADDHAALARRATALWTAPAPSPVFSGYDGEDGADRWNADHPADGLFAFGHVLHVPGRADVTDSAGPRFFTGEYRAAFSDLTLAVDGLSVADDRATVRWTLRGTFTGAFDGLAPTGLAHGEAGSTTYRVANGQIVETWVDAHTADLLRAVGAVPLPPPEPWVFPPAPAPASPNDDAGGEIAPEAPWAA